MHRDAFTYCRRKTREVHIGDLPIGGANPIRVQSMTTLDTMDTQGVVDQSIRLIKAGCEYVRITVPSLKEAKNLETIKNELHTRGYKTPLIADVHFTPNVAEQVARFVEKVRINPGNYADKKHFKQIDYSEKNYRMELDRIHTKFLPLIKVCKKYGTAMRIGTNHGSLSDRIMSRYGDTPLGMVESALEFVRICEHEQYYNIVLSMKASNPQIMIQAYRLLVKKLDEERLQSYPLHLGVTEAGDGDEGRIKSAIGIGTLLEEGLGDTIRVSLTEEPENEIPVAKILADRYKNATKNTCIRAIEDMNRAFPTTYHRRKTHKVMRFGSGQVPPVIINFSQKKQIIPSTLREVGYIYDPRSDKWNIAKMACDYLYMGKYIIDFALPETLELVYDYEIWQRLPNPKKDYPLMSISEYLNAIQVSDNLNFIAFSLNDLSNDFIERIKNDATAVLFVKGAYDDKGLLAQRVLFSKLKEAHCRAPVVLAQEYADLPWDTLLLYAATDTGGLFIDGFGDAICIMRGNENISKLNATTFKILQAARMRISETEYISCPSCGRTLFSLQDTTEKVRKKTNHLKGIKIAIMGCIVNGPGEMADADYGYVGSGKDRITLYRGRKVVKRHIPSDRAVEALIDLIDEDDKWLDPD